ncbi:hypothetical protein Tco_0894173 [Tanacetum coccineum]|uniref:Uncharacterized protein n=1 Tax=Tanacetum coccineum TaxID=301880 RepID=A0ABQ5CB05_9ASTR
MTPHHLGNSGASRKGDDASLNDDGYESKGEDFVDFSHLFDSDQSNNPERYVLRRSSRQHKIPSKFDNYELDKKVRYDINYVMSYVNLSIYNYVFSTNLNKIHEPKTFVEAAKDPRWVEAMNLEIEALNSRKLKYFLRVEVLETDNGLCLNQRKYCIKLLSEYGMLACKPAKTPILDQSKKRKDNDEINSALKAEYRAMNSVTCKIMGILKILKDLNVNVELPVSISCDSSPAIQIAANLILERVGTVAYRLALSDSSKIHPHEGHPMEQPLAICATRVVLQNGIPAGQVLVQWNGSSPEEATWEWLIDFHSAYPTYNLKDKMIFKGEGNVTPTLQEEGRPKRVTTIPVWHKDYVMG